MPYTLTQLGNTFQNQLYDIVCGGDGGVPADRDSFLTWVTPGVTYHESDFDFLVNGVNRQNWQDAYHLATRVDFIPDVRSAYDNDRQQAVYRTPDARLSSLYDRILGTARVVGNEMADEREKQLERLLGRLRVTKVVPDPIRGGTREVTEDSSVYQQYRTYQAETWTARLSYNTKRVMAATGVDPSVITDFAYNGDVYRAMFHAAVRRWESLGYKGHIEDIVEAVDSMTRTSAASWRAGLRSIYRNSVLSTPDGATFPSTSIIPADFASSDAWIRYSMSHDAVGAGTHGWPAGAGVGWGGFRGSAGQSVTSDFPVASFEISFELAQTMIVRPGIVPEWFCSRTWDLPTGRDRPFDGPLSDGQRPPGGRLVGHPVQAIWARNVTITSDAFVSRYRQHDDTEGQVGWGPFALRGRYGDSRGEEEFSSHAVAGSIMVPGMHLIAFTNRLLPRSPDLMPGIGEDQLV